MPEGTATNRFQEKNEQRKKRTLKQNRALHQLFALLADTLNEAGYDMKRTLKADVDIPWTPENIKEYIWRPVQQAQLGINSTTELNTKDIDAVFETINRHLGNTIGVHTPFPSIDILINDERVQEET